MVAAVGLAWLFSPPVPEGPILWSVTTNHGLTAGDLPGLAALAAAGWLLVGALRGRPGGTGRQQSAGGQQGHGDQGRPEDP